MRLETWQAPPGDRIPNNPRFPVLVYRGVEAVTGAEAARKLFAEHGWGGSWVASVFDFHHFHSTSHEALASSRARRRSSSAARRGEAFEVAAGDVLVLPAGTGHRRATPRDGFSVVGAYPPGQEDYDLLREDVSDAELAAARERIANLGPPPRGPGRRGGRSDAGSVSGLLRAQVRAPPINRRCQRPCRSRLRADRPPHLRSPPDRAAAVAAWYLALLLLPTTRARRSRRSPRSSASPRRYGQRRRQAFELVGGVMLGIAVAGALLFLIGTGPLQIALLIVLAMSAALALRGGDDARQRGRGVGDPARLAAAARLRLLDRPRLRGPDRRRRGARDRVAAALARSRADGQPRRAVGRRQARAHARGDRRRARGRRRRPCAAGAEGRARDRRRGRGARGDHPRRQRDRALLARPVAATARSCAATSTRCRRSTSRSATRACSPAPSCATRARPEPAPEELPAAVRELADAVWELGAQYDEPSAPPRAAAACAQRRPPRAPASTSASRRRS